MRRLLAAAVLTLAAAAAPASAADGPSYRLTLEPRELLYGDDVVAEIAVVGAKGAPLRIHTDFRPYRVVRTSVTSATAGGIERRVYRYRLDCLRRACLPGGPEKAVQFAPVRLTWNGRTVTQFWPPLRLASRVDPRDLSQPQLRSNLLDQPRVTYAIAPRRLELALAVAAALLLVYPALLLLRLAHRAWRRVRLSRLERMSPMERALELLRRAAAAPEHDPRRRALERIARELGDDDVAVEARRLAWSRPRPESNEMDTLRSRVRDAP